MTFNDGCWHNEPSSWHIDAGQLHASSSMRTDLWRQTHYGFVRDNGHFLGVAATTSFTAQIMIEGDFHHLYDQAGLMLRADETRWVKGGAEFTDGRLHQSAVVTDDRSDWSVSHSLGTARRFGVQMTLDHGVLRIQASHDGVIWHLIRLTPFQSTTELQIEPMFCSPERSDLKVTFESFELGPPISSDLHSQD